MTILTVDGLGAAVNEDHGKVLALMRYPELESPQDLTEEAQAAREAIEESTGQRRQPRGRPPKSDEEKFIPTSIILHPKVLEWTQREAKRRACEYQTIINEGLLEKAV